MTDVLHIGGSSVEEVEVRGYGVRCSIAAIIFVICSGVLARPARADTVSPPARTTLATVSPSTLKALRVVPPQVRKQQTPAATEPGFFKTRKGAVAIGLMSAGAVFTVWSINHDRKPVKSAIR